MGVPWQFGTNPHSMLPETTQVNTGSTGGNLTLAVVGSFSNLFVAAINTPIEMLGYGDEGLSHSSVAMEWQAFKDMGPGEAAELSQDAEAAPQAIAAVSAELGGVFRTGAFLYDVRGGVNSSKVVPGAVDAASLPPLRQAYVKDVSALGDLGASARAAGQSPQDTARMLVDMRNQLKLDYRVLSPADAVRVFEERNLLKYANPVGPSADQLRAGGRTWEQIIDGASRS